MKISVIKYCESCKKRGPTVKTQLLPKIKKAFPDALLESKCLSFCGPGSRQPFVYVDDTLIYAADDEQLIAKIKEHLEQE
ncbi:MAG: DUF1450 domain-containing protein [Culicoidibacterales bacterium]